MATYDQAVSLLRTGKLEEGIALLSDALRTDPHSPDIRNAMGAALLQTGRTKEAEEHFLAALKTDPGHVKALANYGGLLTGQGRFDEAEKVFSRALEKNPNHAETLNNMGLLMEKRNLPNEAELYFRRAISAAPGIADFHSNLGFSLIEQQRHAEAEELMRRALKINPEHANAIMGLGLSLPNDPAHLPEIESCYVRALEVNPRLDKAWYLLATLYETTSRIDKARSTVEKGRKVFPFDAGLALIEAKILRRAGKENEAIAALETILPALDAAPLQNYPVYYELGRLYDRQGNPDKAYEYFEKANDACAAKNPEMRTVDRSMAQAAISCNRALFTKSWIDSWTALAPPGPDDPQPVFLIGFPRSGTTLLDQILSSHPAIAVAEEKPVIATMVAHLERSARGYADSIARMTDDEAAALRRMFFDLHKSHGADTAKPVFIDRMPYNMTRAGLIYRLFPGARFILALRHPCDSVLSCLMQDFSLNHATVHFLTLEDTAAAYDDYFSIWRQYNGLLPLNVHTIKYEDVVSDFRTSVAGLLGFLGVPWNDAVLSYDQTARDRAQIKTASYAQVTEKIYTRASGRWTKYKRHMSSVLDTLAPWAAAFGYEPIDVDGAVTESLAADPAQPALWLKHGERLRRALRHNDAITCYREAVAACPQDEALAFFLAFMLEFSNRLDEAETAISAARARGLKSRMLALVEAKILRRRGDSTRALSVLDAALPPAGTETPPDFLFFYERGDILDRLGRTEEAFAAFEKANALQAATPEAQVVNREKFPALIRACRETVWPSIKAEQETTPRPVFLVGFPRSGTTLLETMLAGHPDIEAADEKPAVAALLNSVPSYPAGIKNLTPSNIADLRARFFTLHKSYGAAMNRPVFIDKMPLSLLHAGFIHSVFPEAKFIFALRHPCDVVLSCFMQNFSLNDAMIQFLALDDAARAYDATMDLWEYYRSALPLAVHDIRYEDTVADPRAAAKGVLDFIGLPWHDNVLAPEKNAVSVRTSTPGYAQTGSGIYTNASGRWKKYEAFMAPSLPVLSRWIERHGYKQKG